MISNSSVTDDIHIRFKRLPDKKMSELVSALFAECLSEIAQVYEADDIKLDAKLTNEE